MNQTEPVSVTSFMDNLEDKVAWAPDEILAAAEETSIGASIRLSSGLPHLDLALTPDPNLQPGIIGLGQVYQVIARTGQGKSSLIRKVNRAIAQDLANYGYEHAKVLLFATEEEREDVLEDSGLLSHPRYKALADRQVRIAQVGSSRAAIVNGLFQTTYAAIIEAKQLNIPVADCLPFYIGIDYDQGIYEASENRYGDARIRMANLLTNGVAKWSVEEIEKSVSTLQFTKGDTKFPATWYGFLQMNGLPKVPFPENKKHRVAVMITAQVRAEGDTSTKTFNDSSSWTDYTKPKTAGGYFWDPREGDVPLISKENYAGDRQIQQDATQILILYRPRPDVGPRVLPEGTPHVKGSQMIVPDPRAFVLIDKQRKGASTPVVPLAFSSAVTGGGGQWFDGTAEAQVALMLTGGPDTRDWRWDFHDDLYLEEGFGGPILPHRPKRALDEVRYPDNDPDEAFDEVEIPDSQWFSGLDVVSYDNHEEDLFADVSEVFTCDGFDGDVVVIAEVAPNEDIPFFFDE